MTARVILVIGCLIPLVSAAAEAWKWRPFEPVRRPPTAGGSAPNPIDAFLTEELAAKGLSYREPASREILLRRVYLDLIGLAPTPEERARFLEDAAPDAYDRLVDRLLADPRHAERWARHWMDVWRYSDWAGWSDGKQIRDSQPHIWRWRDWIVESLEADVGYDRMVVDMLAADERAPEDMGALRATGFLVRNYKMLSREQWLEDTVKHSSLAFMGLTVGCAKCHDHKTDALPQTEYYALRAVFEPHQVRLDAVPGQADTAVDGLPRVYDADLTVPTYFFPRGDERSPDKNRPIAPGVPSLLGGSLEIVPVSLPPAAVAPQRRETVRRDLEAAAVAAAQSPGPGAWVARARLASLRAVFAAERLEDAGKKDSPEWQAAARAALAAQREEAVASALHHVVAATLAHAEAAQKNAAAAAEPAAKLAEARTALAAARAKAAEPLTHEFSPRPLPAYPATSSGRRLAFARWLTRPGPPADRAGGREPCLGPSLWCGPGPVAGGFRRGRAPAQPPGPARLACGRVHGKPMVVPSPPSPHLPERRLPPVERGNRRSAWSPAPRHRQTRPRSIPTTACSGGFSRAGSKPKPSATTCCTSPAGSILRGAARSSTRRRRSPRGGAACTFGAPRKNKRSFFRSSTDRASSNATNANPASCRSRRWPCSTANWPSPARTPRQPPCHRPSRTTPWSATPSSAC